MTEHHYEIELTWTGNTGTGTSSPRAYSRDHVVTGEHVAPIAASSDPAFRGDPQRWNPEQLYVASIAQCHMLWYLDLATRAGITVTAYEDRPTGIMREEAGGAGQFDSVTLHPTVTITNPDHRETAKQIHHRVADYCFIARSVKTPIHHEPVVVVANSLETTS